MPRIQKTTTSSIALSGADNPIPGWIALVGLITLIGSQFAAYQLKAPWQKWVVRIVGGYVGIMWMVLPSLQKLGILEIKAR